MDFVKFVVFHGLATVALYQSGVWAYSFLGTDYFFYLSALYGVAVGVLYAYIRHVTFEYVQSKKKLKNFYLSRYGDVKRCRSLIYLWSLFLGLPGGLLWMAEWPRLIGNLKRTSRIFQLVEHLRLIRKDLLGDDGAYQSKKVLKAVKEKAKKMKVTDPGEIAEMGEIGWEALRLLDEIEKSNEMQNRVNEGVRMGPKEFKEGADQRQWFSIKDLMENRIVFPLLGNIEVLSKKVDQQGEVLKSLQQDVFEIKTAVEASGSESAQLFGLAEVITSAIMDAGDQPMNVKQRFKEWQILLEVIAKSTKHINPGESPLTKEQMVSILVDVLSSARLLPEDLSSDEIKGLLVDDDEISREQKRETTPSSEVEMDDPLQGEGGLIDPEDEEIIDLSLDDLGNLDDDIELEFDESNQGSTGSGEETSDDTEPLGDLDDDIDCILEESREFWKQEKTKDGEGSSESSDGGEAVKSPGGGSKK